MTALCSGKICTIFPEKGALNFWKACTIALEYSDYWINCNDRLPDRSSGCLSDFGHSSPLSPNGFPCLDAVDPANSRMPPVSASPFQDGTATFR